MSRSKSSISSSESTNANEIIRKKLFLKQQKRAREKEEFKENKKYHPENIQDTDNSNNSNRKQNTLIELKRSIPPLEKNNDPSLQYLLNPQKIPIIKKMKKWYKNLEYKINKNEPLLIMGKIKEWRCHAKIPVRRYTSSNGIEYTTMGLFAPNSHTILPGIEDCPVHHKYITKGIQYIKQSIDNCKILGYSDTDGSGYLRYVCFTVASIPAPNGYSNMLISSSSSSSSNILIDDTSLYDTNISNGKVQLVIVWNDMGSDNEKPWGFNTPPIIKSLPNHKDGLKYLKKYKNTLYTFIKDLLHIDKDFWNSIYINYQNSWSHTNTIYSYDINSWQLVYGLPAIAEYISLETKSTTVPTTLYFLPNVFHQSNLLGFSNIINTIRKLIPLNSCVLELYGGIGTISLNIIDKCKSIVCSDENINCANCFYASVASIIKTNSQILYNRSIQYYTKDAIQMIQEKRALKDSIISNTHFFKKDKQILKNLYQFIINPIYYNGDKKFLPFNVCIVDPPRKGLQPQVIDAIVSALHLKYLFYISCGFDSLVRDISILCKDEKIKNVKPWKLYHIEFHILFPGTNHIETLAFFQRS